MAHQFLATNFILMATTAHFDTPSECALLQLT